jgi:two-component system sensor histidine kinase SenX3
MELSGGPALALVAGTVLVFLLLVWALWARRGVSHRLATIAARLETGPVSEVKGSLDHRVDRLEHAVADAVGRHSDARMAEGRLAGALDQVSEGIVVADEDGVVVYRNLRAAEFVDARHGEALAEKSVRDLLDAALMGEQRSQTLDLFGPPRRTLVVTALPLDDGARTVGAAAVVVDVSERRRLEAVRRDFVANISHELKTPVGALGLLAETLLAEGDRGVARRLAERMHVEAIRVGRIIDDLLDLSRIEAEESPLREPVPVHLMLAEAAERVRPLAEHRGIRVDVGEVARRLTVLGDRRQLVSAVHNLMENAVKYSDDGSKVQIRARTDGRWVDIGVRDEGVGIPSRDLERIFERFYRVDRARSRETGGTGLGLAIVRHVATNHGGEVLVQSQEGSGSTFTLRLPAGPGAVILTDAEAG